MHEKDTRVSIQNKENHINVEYIPTLEEKLPAEQKKKRELFLSLTKSQNFAIQLRLYIK